MVLKTFESPLDSKNVNPKGNQPPNWTKIIPRKENFRPILLTNIDAEINKN